MDMLCMVCLDKRAWGGDVTVQAAVTVYDGTAYCYDHIAKRANWKLEAERR